MTSRRTLSDDAISRFIAEEEESEHEREQGSDSEIEDNLSEDDIQSDFEDEFIDDEVPQQLNDTQNEDDISPPVSSEPTGTSESSRRDHRIIVPDRRVLRGKNQHCWSTIKGQSRGRTSAINIIRTSRGPTRMCRNICDPILCFNLFVTDEIVDEVVRWTNVEISVKRRDNMIKATFRDTSVTEVQALFAILTLSAAMKDNHLSTDELFDSSFSGTRYVAVMSRDRFDFLLRCLRFDDKSIRPSLRHEDPFIHIRKIWELFVTQCKLNYTPGEHVTIDEQLLGFRGRCPFRMYIPNKPSKYGIKIPMLCDSGTKYMLNAMPYIGRATNTNGMPQGEFYVKELSRPLHGTNRNITCDNWFTSVPLAKSLLQEPYKLTLVGTLRSNKREIPEELKNTRSRSVGTSMFCYDGCLTLVSYKPKPSKMVYLLSSCDEDGVINPITGKPEIIMYYNQTKGGVDTFDQMCSSMSCSRKTNRWPMSMFYGILNIAFVNSYVIYCHNILAKNEKPLNRRGYMKKLSAQLSESWMKERLEAPTLPKHVRDNIANILPKPVVQNDTDNEEEPPAKKRRYCTFCTNKKKRMSKMTCVKCRKTVCGEHKNDVCFECLSNQI
ncbi:unnamed protein product [Parnassius mnemosyne]|uniref:PiggyBac transposable element-derived protein domain-containing protein n=1 Tax=Parnassius mnemosyne TaxID=213953 RepID=A0AAV1LRB5_9NEOP